MKVPLVSVGNSRGIRIPKPIIEQCGLGDTVELTIEGDHLVIAPESRPRQGWDEAFRAAGSAAADELLLDVGPSSFDEDEWEW
jgi:antitoxin MazE